MRALCLGAEALGFVESLGSFRASKSRAYV